MGKEELGEIIIMSVVTRILQKMDLNEKYRWITISQYLINI